MPEPQHALPEHDPISVASARMFARGVPSSDRMAALKLLGVLMDHAQQDGRVAFDADVLAAELAAGINEAHRYYRWLEASGVLVREPAGWRIDGFTPSPSNVSNAAALDVLAQFLERDHRSADERPVPAAPGLAVRPAEPVTAHRQSTDAEVVPIEMAHRRRALPALAGVAAAAAIAWMIAIVNTGAGPTATQIAIDEPLARAATRQPGTIMLAAPTPVAGQGEQATRAPAAAADGGKVRVAGPSTPGALASCAPARPKLRIQNVEVISAEETEQPGLRSRWLVLVTGTLENPGRAPLEVRSFDIDVDTSDGTLTTSGLQAPVMLPAGTVSPWTTILYAGRDEPDSPKAQAFLRDWSHTGPASC